MLMSREDIAQIGSIEYVFKCRKDLDPYVWSILSRNKAINLSDLQDFFVLPLARKAATIQNITTTGIIHTYRALKKNTSQVNIGRTGRKNCLVIGMSSARIRRDAAPVLTTGPGAWLIEREKIASMIRIMYWPS